MVPLFAEEVDLSSLYECDDFFCPGQGQSPADQMLRENIGIVVPPVPTIDFQPRRVIINDRGVTRPGRSQETASAPDLINENSDIASVPEESSYNNGTEEAQQTENQPGSFNQQGAGGMNAAQGGFNNPSGGGISAASVPHGNGGSVGRGSGNYEADFGSNQGNVKGGLLYADDTPTHSNPVVNNPSNSNREKRESQQDKTPQGGAFASAGSGAMPSAPAGGGSGRSAVTPRAQPDGLLDRLKNIATNLGEKFFGLSGSGGKNNSRRLASGNANRAVNNNGSSKRPSPDMRNLLQNRLNQYRGLASQLEFAKSNTHLFGNMCKHYRAYALKHRIPNDESGCPK